MDGRDGMGWDGTGWDGTERDGTGRDGTGWDGMGWAKDDPLPNSGLGVNMGTDIDRF